MCPLRLTGFSTSLSSLPIVRISVRMSGDSTVLCPEANSGFLLASTIWIDSPSTVISRRIWSRSASSAGIFRIDSSSFCFRSRNWRFSSSLRFFLPSLALRLT